MQEFTMTIVDRETHFRAPAAGGTVQILSMRQGGALYETLFERRGMGAAEHAGPGDLERVVRAWHERNYPADLPRAPHATTPVEPWIAARARDGMLDDDAWVDVLSALVKRLDEQSIAAREAAGTPYIPEQRERLDMACALSQEAGRLARICNSHSGDGEALLVDRVAALPDGARRAWEYAQRGAQMVEA